jgi:hypothetical protein
MVSMCTQRALLVWDSSRVDSGFNISRQTPTHPEEMAGLLSPTVPWAAGPADFDTSVAAKSARSIAGPDGADASHSRSQNLGMTKSTLTTINAALDFRQEQAVRENKDGGGGGTQDADDDFASATTCSALLQAPAFSEALRHSSLFIFAPTNPVRVVIYNLQKHKFFEAVVIVLILANCVFLALDRPLEPDPSYQMPVDIFFTAAFTLEMLLKWVALGVFAHPGAYIRNPWNVLDFIIVCFSYLSFHPSIGNLTAFRVLRVARPLRSMNAIRGLQVLVIGLMSSMRGLVHVAILSFFAMLIFSILGVQLFGGQFRMQCFSLAEQTFLQNKFCDPSGTPGGYWGIACPDGFECRAGTNPFYGRYHFDDVGHGLLTIFTIVTFDDWPTAMKASMATTGALSFFFYFFAVITCSYFVTNLALAVINDEFIKASEAADASDQARLEQDQRSAQQKQFKRIGAMPDSASLNATMSSAVFEEEVSAAAAGTSTEALVSGDRSSWRHRAWEAWHRFRDVLHQTTEGYPRIDSPFIDELLEKKRVEDEGVRNVKIAERRARIEKARGHVDGADGKAGAAALSDALSTDMRSSTNNDEMLTPQEQAEKQIMEEEALEGDEPPTPIFVKVIVVFILLNTLVLASQHYNQPGWLDNTQVIANRILTAIFALEFVLRLTALFPYRYAQDAFNNLDGIVVIVSLVELGLNGSSTVSVLRALRLLRVLKLLRSFPSLRQIIQVTLIAVKDTSYLLLIITLYLFIVALVGMQFFAGRIQDTRAVYDDFVQAFFTVFQTLTLDGWVALMYESMERTTDAAVIYYVTQIVLGNYVLLSLFLSILLSSFDSLEPDTGEVVNENAIVYQLFDMSVAQSIFGRGAATKEELAEAAWVEPQRCINLNPHIQREFNRACFYLKKAVPQEGAAERNDEVASDDGHIAVEPSTPALNAAQREVSSSTFHQASHTNNNTVGVAGNQATPTRPGSAVGTPREAPMTVPRALNRPPELQVESAGTTPQGSRLMIPTRDIHAVHEPLSPRSQRERDASRRSSAFSSRTSSSHRQSAKEAGAAGRGTSRGASKAERLAGLRKMAQPHSLFEYDNRLTLTGRKKNRKQSQSENGSESSAQAKKRELLGLGLTRAASMRSSRGRHNTGPKLSQTASNGQGSGDEFVTMLASAPLVEEKKKKERPEDIYCPHCHQEMPIPLPSAPLVLPPTRKQLHKVQCHFISVRLAKTHVLNALADIVTMYIAEGTPTKMKYIDPLVGQAWQVGLLLSETCEKFADDYNGWHRLMIELAEERDILELRVGEEQLGRSLIAYAMGNVPTEHKTNGGWSCFCLGPRNAFRVFVSRTVQHPWFDRVVLCLIILNTSFMAADNPLDDPESVKVTTLFWISVFFNACFAIEMMLKIIALGFVAHEGSYLRDGWNVLDGFIVTVSLVSYVLTDVDISFLRVFRTLRALRPLRVINRNRGLKMVVRTLLESIKGIANVSLICSINYLIFGILAVQFFGGNFQSCTDPAINTKPECTGQYFDVLFNQTFAREWRSEPRNFDNIMNAVLVLFEVSSGESWGPILYRAIDACSDEIGPQKNCNLASGLFFVAFFAITGFFLINLFVGVVIHNFKMVKEQMDGSTFMTDEQKHWVSTQQLMLNFRPAVAMKPRPGSAVAEMLFSRIVARSWFDVAIGAAIFLNIVALAMDHYDMNKDMEFGLKIVDYAFIAIFSFEAAIKLFCFGTRYFRSGWNQFDFFLVIISIGNLGVNLAGSGVGVNVSVLRVFRMFRILRLLRLVRQAKKIRVLLETLWYSLPSMANIGMFVLLVDFIYGVLGVDLFANIAIPPNAQVLDADFANFRRLDNALIMLFEFQTVTYWVGVMRDCMVQAPYCDGNCGSQFAPLYFMSYLIITAFVITNLLIAIILDNFETTMKLDSSELRMSDLNRFVEIWSEFDDGANMTIPTAEFARLLAQLQPPLGLSRVQSRRELLAQTAKYRIPEHGGYIHFIETLIPLARTVKVEEQGEGHLELTDFEVREHEAMWRLSFPHLEELPTLRYREHTVTVDQYYCSTYIGAAYRVRAAKVRANALRYDKLDAMIKHCDEHDIAYETVPYLRKFMDFYVTERQRQADEALLVEKARALGIDVEAFGADRAIREMSRLGQMPKALKVHARWRAKELQPHVALARTIGTFSSRASSLSPRGVGPGSFAASAVSTDSAGEGGMSGNEGTAKSGRYHSAIDAEAAARDERERRKIPLKRSTNRKRVDQSAPLDASPAAFGSPRGAPATPFASPHP